MRRCAICHRPIVPGRCVVRNRRPHVTICFDCMGIRFTEDGELYYDPDLDKSKGRWD